MSIVQDPFVYLCVHIVDYSTDRRTKVFNFSLNIRLIDCKCLALLSISYIFLGGDERHDVQCRILADGEN